jgi:hypothetical protein
MKFLKYRFEKAVFIKPKPTGKLSAEINRESGGKYLDITI